MNNFVAGKETKPRKTAAKALIGFIAIIILLTLGSRTLESLSMANVVVIRPSGGTIERRFELNGYMEIAGDQIIKAEDTLKVIKVHTSLGAYVDAGKPLITFDIATLSDKLEFANDDLKRKKLNLEIMKLPVEVTTPEEYLANAKKIWEGVQKQVKESEENSLNALIEAEKLLNKNTNLIKPTIALTLENFEKALLKAQEDYTTNIELATKNYDRALRDYNELTDPLTGTLAKRRLEAYDAYLEADKALNRAKTDGQKAISNAEAAVTSAAAERDAAQAAYDAITDPAKVDEKQAAKDALDAAEAALLIAQETLSELQAGYNSSLVPYQKARDNALNYYNQVSDMNSPINKDQIDAALENTKNALKNLIIL